MASTDPLSEGVDDTAAWDQSPPSVEQGGGASAAARSVPLLLGFVSWLRFGFPVPEELSIVERRVLMLCGASATTSAASRPSCLDVVRCFVTTSARFAV